MLYLNLILNLNNYYVYVFYPVDSVMTDSIRASVEQLKVIINLNYLFKFIVGMLFACRTRFQYFWKLNAIGLIFTCRRLPLSDANETIF